MFLSHRQNNFSQQHFLIIHFLIELIFLGKHILGIGNPNPNTWKNKDAHVSQFSRPQDLIA